MKIKRNGSFQKCYFYTLRSLRNIERTRKRFCDSRSTNNNGFTCCITRRIHGSDCRDHGSDTSDYDYSVDQKTLA
ncbi:hypothetical protein Y032_0005g2422 [Ancylostoma ceylanicum]|uniref:Uncharacterized protein n=1 Tax=Ancylostoma ceylanicum TaxID=53326 RepID=A0A016VR92_9BILA|nr:hypothetical protein Y032_0005g2422 [Ancylostoma ceylanicum]